MSYKQESISIPVSGSSIFTLSYSPDVSTLMVFVNGVYQRQDTDYLIAGNAMTFSTLLLSSYNLYTAYNYSQSLIEHLTTSSPYASVYQLLYPPDTNSLLLFVNGISQTLTTDYSLVSSVITFTSLIPSAYDVFAAYKYSGTGVTIEAGSYIQQAVGATVPGANSFQLQYTPNNVLMVFLNGVHQTQSIDYNLINSNYLVFNSIIPSSYNVFAVYDTATTATCTPITPVSYHGSTTLNCVITSYEKLATRILYQIGEPLVQSEICDSQMYDFINQACEWYSKYAGYTEEFLCFDSSQYQVGYGLKMDQIISTLSHCYACGTTVSAIPAYYDCDMLDYRKVIDVFSLEMGESTNVNTLFTLEQTMAQQTYFSYMLGNAGFDLVTWEILKQWLDLRQKMFAQVPYVMFDKRTQILRIIPEPTANFATYYGLLGLWVERPLRDLIQERWVGQYALALAKISIGQVRGKFGNVQLFGSGTVNYNDLLSQGLTEKEKLEQELMTNFGEVTPPRFFVG